MISYIGHDSIEDAAEIVAYLFSAQETEVVRRLLRQWLQPPVEPVILLLSDMADRAPRPRLFLDGANQAGMIHADLQPAELRQAAPLPSRDPHYDVAQRCET